MHLTWAICHDTGKRKGFIGTRSNAEVVIELNGQRSATVETSLEEHVSTLIRPGRTRVKVWLHRRAGEPGGAIVHNGLIIQPRSLGTRIEIPSVGPHFRLLKAGVDPLPEGPGNPDNWSPQTYELSEAMWEIIYRAEKRQRELQALADPGNVIPDFGVIQGVLADSGLTDEFFFPDGKTAWDELTDQAKGKHMPDFDFAPLDRDDSVNAQFDTYHPRMGRDLTNTVILEFGRNLSGDENSITIEPNITDLCNRCVMVGRSVGSSSQAPAWVTEDTISIGRYGIHQFTDSRDTSDLDKLQKAAEAYVERHAFQTNFIEVVPAVETDGLARGYARTALGDWIAEPDNEYEVPPAFGPGDDFDYWLGDEITVRAKDQFTFDIDRDQAGPDTDFRARVTAATLREVDDAGNVGVALTLAPVVDSDMAGAVGGYASRVKTALPTA